MARRPRDSPIIHVSNLDVCVASLSSTVIEDKTSQLTLKQIKSVSLAYINYSMLKLTFCLFRR